MKTDNCCRDPVVPDRVRYAVERRAKGYMTDRTFLNILLEQGVLNQREVKGAKVQVAIVIDLADGNVVVVNEQGLVL